MSVNVVFAAKFDKSGLQTAQKEIASFGKSVKNVLGGFGVVALFSGVSRALNEAGKAAAADAKSQGLLANALRNSVGASDQVIQSVEDQIAKFQTTTGVLDDNLRPAYAAAVRAMGDVGKANDLMSVALDISASTGKDLTLVVKSISRALDGNAAGLQRLVPGIKVTDDILGSLKTQFAGAADAANRLDPYQRMNVAINDLQEKIGIALIPSLNKLADWLTSSGTQEAIAFLTDYFSAMALELQNTADGAVIAADALASLLDISPEAAKSGWTALFDSIGQQMKNIIYGPVFSKFAGLLEAMGRVKGQAAKNITSASRLAGQRKADSGGLYTALQMQKKYGVTPKTPSAKKKAAADFAAKKLAAEQAAAKAAADAAAALAAQIKQLKDEFRKAIQGSFKDLLAKEIPAMGAFEQKVYDTFTGIKDTIMNADKLIMSKKKKAIFLGLAEFAQQQLSKIAKQRDELAMKIENAKSFMDSVKDAVFGQVNINEMGRSSKAIIMNFQKIITRTLEFKKNIAALQQAGLGTDALKQIIEGGVDAGGATAQALLRGGAGAISEVNSLFGQLTDAAAGVSETAGQIMFGSGVDLSNGLIAGLLSQEEQLKIAADTLATAFQDQFNKRLGLGKADTGFINVGGTTKAGTVINLTVNAPMGAGNNIGKLIIDEISKFERTSGIVFARA